MKSSKVSRKITLEDNQKQTEKKYTQKRICFGRNADNRIMTGDVNIEIAHSSISRLHCSIMSYDDTYYLIDEKSCNGTYIRVPSKNLVVLKDKMVLKIGAIQYTVHLKHYNKVELTFTNLHGTTVVDRKVQMNISDGREVGLGFLKNEEVVSADDNFIGVEDKDLSSKYKNHVIFKRNEDFLVVAECIGM